MVYFASIPLDNDSDFEEIGVKNQEVDEADEPTQEGLILL